MDKTCLNCKGFGVGVVKSSGYCIHCTRTLKLLFDPDTNKYTKDLGYVDISPSADGGILKKIIKEGKGENPEEGCPTFIQYVGRLENGTIFETTREFIDGVAVGGTDDPFEFQLLREKIVKGWDIGISTMNCGEIANFVIAPEYAYGEAGYEPKVQPGDSVIYETELIEFKESLPRFPSKEEMDEVDRKRREEEERIYKENPPPTPEERVKESNKEKEKGNKLFSEKNYEEAQKCYDHAFVNIFCTKEEWAFFSEQEQKVINDCKLNLHLNRGMCKIKQQKWDDAMWDCNSALELDPGNVKGSFRRAKVHLGKLSLLIEKEKNGEYWDVEKGYEIVKSCEADLEVARSGSENDKSIDATAESLEKYKKYLKAIERKYEQDSKNLFKKILKTSVVEGEREEKKKKRLNEEDNISYDDMPELDEEK